MSKSIILNVKRTLFEKEYKILENSEKIISKYENNSISLNPELELLLYEYRFLTKNYSKILKSAIKITNIGDKNQQKLYQANNKINQQKKDIELRNRKLYQLSISDQLTKIYNRTFVLEKLEEEFEKSLKTNDCLSCIIFDIDHFKLINDNNGHLVGDFVLEKLAKLIKQKLPQNYYFGRYGGEEFIIILPKTDILKAKELAEEVRISIIETNFIYNSTTINITLSIGISDNKFLNLLTVDELLNNADSAMYKAKNNGRNQTFIFNEISNKK